MEGARREGTTATGAEVRAASRALLRLEVVEGPLDTPCWIWPGSTGGKMGHGQLRVGARVMQVHRLLYRVLVGEPPPRWHLHHRCETPRCGNPEHLQPVTVPEHVRLSPGPFGDRARQTECGKGHPFDEKNTAITYRGTRRCRACHREGERDRRARLAA